MKRRPRLDFALLSLAFQNQPRSVISEATVRLLFVSPFPPPLAFLPFSCPQTAYRKRRSSVRLFDSIPPHPEHQSFSLRHNPFLSTLILSLLIYSAWSWNLMSSSCAPFLCRDSYPGHSFPSILYPQYGFVVFPFFTWRRLPVQLLSSLLPSPNFGGFSPNGLFSGFLLTLQSELFSIVRP